MPEPQIFVNVMNQSVNVRVDVSTRAGKTRFLALSFFVGFALLLMGALLFSPGKGGHPSMWHDMSTSAVGSAGFMVPFFLILSFPLLMGILTSRYVTLAYPSDETFTCDRSTLTISRVRWLDVHNNHWNTWTYSLSEIQEIRYRSIARLRGYSIYGLRLIAGGKTWRLLPGLKPKDAEKVLSALKTFGVFVPDDQLLQRKLNEDSSSE